MRKADKENVKLKSLQRPRLTSRDEWYMRWVYNETRRQEHNMVAVRKRDSSFFFRIASLSPTRQDFLLGVAARWTPQPQSPSKVIARHPVRPTRDSNKVDLANGFVNEYGDHAWWQRVGFPRIYLNKQKRRITRSESESVKAVRWNDEPETTRPSRKFYEHLELDV